MAAQLGIDRTEHHADVHPVIVTRAPAQTVSQAMGVSRRRSRTGHADRPIRGGMNDNAGRPGTTPYRRVGARLRNLELITIREDRVADLQIPIAKSALENCQVQAACATPHISHSSAQPGRARKGGRPTNQEVASKVGERFYRPLAMHAGLRVRGWLLNLTTCSPARGPGRSPGNGRSLPA